MKFIFTTSAIASIVTSYYSAKEITSVSAYIPSATSTPCATPTIAPVVVTSTPCATPTIAPVVVTSTPCTSSTKAPVVVTTPCTSSTKAPVVATSTPCTSSTKAPVVATSTPCLTEAPVPTTTPCLTEAPIATTTPCEKETSIAPIATPPSYYAVTADAEYAVSTTVAIYASSASSPSFIGALVVAIAFISF